jgi:hypothetical protein
MKLLTEELRARLPRLYAQEAAAEAIVYALCCRQHKAYYVVLTVM